MDIRFWSNDEYDSFLEQVTSYEARIENLVKTDKDHGERLGAAEKLAAAMKLYDGEVDTTLKALKQWRDSANSSIGLLERRASSLEQADRDMRVAQDGVNSGVTTRLNTLDKKATDNLDLYKNLSKQLDALKALYQTDMSMIRQWQVMIDNVNALVTEKLTAIESRLTKLETPPPAPEVSQEPTV